MSECLHLDVQEIIRESANEQRFQFLNHPVGYFVSTEICSKVKEFQLRVLWLTELFVTSLKVLVAFWMMNECDCLHVTLSVER